MKSDTEPGEAASPRDRKATWTLEDRDYVWLTRTRSILLGLQMLVPAPLGAWLLFQSTWHVGTAKYAYQATLVLLCIASALVTTAILARFDRWLTRRFPENRERALYAGRAWPPYIDDAIDSFETGEIPRSKLRADRAAILAPLGSRVAWFRHAIQRTAIVQWTIAALSAAYATSSEAHAAHQTGAAITIALALLASGFAWPSIWQFLIYDVPARLNPLFAPVHLTPSMAAVLENACEDDGQIWLVDHKPVPRALFKTPFGPLLLGEPWTTAFLPFGLWKGHAHIRKEMSGEIRGYYRITEFLANAVHEYDEDNDYR